MAGFTVDLPELTRSAGAAQQAGTRLAGAEPVSTQAEQAATRLRHPDVVARALVIADTTGKMLAEGAAVLGGVAGGLRYIADHYDVADQTFH